MFWGKFLKKLTKLFTDSTKTIAPFVGKWWLLALWRENQKPIGYYRKAIEGILKGEVQITFGILYTLRATFPFSRLGVRDHTGGPGGSLHTFSPERKYDISSSSVCPSDSHLPLKGKA